jgi:hypothetical protein
MLKLRSQRQQTRVAGRHQMTLASLRQQCDTRPSGKAACSFKRVGLSIRRNGYERFPHAVWRRIRDSDAVIKLLCVGLVAEALAIALWLSHLRQ